MNTRIPPPDQRNDLELASAWIEGDRSAGAALFNRYYDSLSRFFVCKVGLVDTEDLVQDTFLGFQKSFANYRGDAQVKTYLFRIARNKLADYLRRRSRDRKRFDTAEVSIADLRTGFSQQVIKAERDKLLLEALCSLPIDTQIALELYYWERMKVAEVAQLVDKSTNNVKVILHRGRKKLEERMAQLADSPADLQASLTSLSRWAARVREEV